MYNDQYGQIIFDANDICSLYLQDPNKKLYRVLVEKDIPFHNDLGLTNLPETTKYIPLDIPLEEFDTINQNTWFMPEEYKNFDIAKYVLSLCKNDEELQRAGQELLLFQEKNMFTLLQYLKYLVDVMRENNIVWGVGRGSSVSSFVLYLLGIHKINSLYYDLNIEEFIK